MTIEARSWHEVYANRMDKDEREAVDAAYNAAIKALQEKGVQCAFDDRAEELVAAIAKYFVESKYEPIFKKP